MLKKISLSPFYILLLLLQLGFIILYFAASHFWVLQIFSVIPPFLFLVPGSICLLISLFKKDIIAILLSLSCSLLGFLFIEFNPSLLFGSEPQDTHNSVIVFNSNTTLWNQKDPEEYMKFLKSQNADIYQLQEVIPPRGKGNVDTKIFNKYFPDYTIIAHHELVTLSRLAVTDSEYREPNDFQRVTVNLDGKGVDFYNVHMRIHLLPELYRQPVEFLRETKERYNWRHEQFRQLLDGVKKSEKAYISGDFNTSKTMGMMRPLQEVTKDSFSQSSDVFPVTWDMKGNSWWRIDYNLVKGIELLKHENVEQAEYSDHRAQRVFIDID